MRGVLLPLHILFAGAWLGCVLTEVFFERALLGKGHDKELLLARLHRSVDLFVEAPAFVLVLVTGYALRPSLPVSGLLTAKIGLALLAVVANVYCVRLVLRRSAFATAGRWADFDAADRLQHKWGAVVLLGILGAGILGLMIAAGV